MVSAMSMSFIRVTPWPREPKIGLTTMSPPSSLKAARASFTLSVANVRGTGTFESSSSAKMSYLSTQCSIAFGGFTMYRPLRSSL